MIDAYMWGTANGLRATLALAECGLEHRIHKVDLSIELQILAYHEQRKSHGVASA